jgi:hypothetical protein
VPKSCARPPGTPRGRRQGAPLADLRHEARPWLQLYAPLRRGGAAQRSRLVGLALRPEPRPKARRPPTRVEREAMSLGEQDSTCRASTLVARPAPATWSGLVLSRTDSKATRDLPQGLAAEASFTARWEAPPTRRRSVHRNESKSRHPCLQTPSGVGHAPAAGCGTRSPHRHRRPRFLRAVAEA